MRNLRLLLMFTMLVGVSLMLSGCPFNARTPYVGLWDFNDNFTVGDFRWELLANGTVVETDIGNGFIPGSFTWDLLNDSTMIFYQDDGANQWVLTGAIQGNNLVSGVSIQTNGANAGTNGTWSLIRVVN